MKAGLLIKANIDTLLRARNQSRKDLAQYCYKSESWISKIFKEPRRAFSLRDVDRIADFFGIATYQLFQPGISSLTERRLSERRVSSDRRIGHAQRAMLSTAVDIDAHRPPRKGAPHAVVASSSPVLEAVHRETEAYERRISALLAQHTGSGGQAPSPRRALPPAPEGGRAAGRSHPRKT